MQKKSQSFYIFCAIVALFLGLCVWALVSLHSVEEVSSEERAEHVEVKGAVPPSSKLLAVSLHSGNGGVRRSAMDMGKLDESLEGGAEPTQELGERGSLEGALVTKEPMTYHESRFERLPNSPLYIFTDEMIRESEPGTYEANREALRDQSRHLQEASIALSVSPRVEYGKTTGYRLVEIPERTLFSKLGMVSGDIIVSINGALPDMEPMSLMFVKMAAGRQGASTIVVDHRGVERTIHLRAVE